MKRALLAAAAVVVGVIVWSDVDAQTSPRIVSPGRADQNPPAARTRAPRTPYLNKARDADAPITPFVLTKVVLDGSSLDASQIDAATAPFVGQTIDNTALNKITQAVAAAYPHADIALFTVLVPEQRFAGGVLHLSTVEGYVEAIQVQGPIGDKRRTLIARYLEPLVKERPLTTTTLQRYLSLIRDIPGETVDYRLERGRQQGAVRLVVAASAKTVQLAIGVNNRGTALLGRTQVQADLFLNSLLVGGDQTRATVVLPTQTRLFQYYALSYAAPLNADGTTGQVNASYLRTRPKDLPLAGKAVSFGGQVSHPLIRGFNRNLYVTGSLDGVNSDNALFGQTFSSDRTRAARGAVSYTRATDKNLLTVSGTVSLGLNVLGARVTDSGLSDKTFRKLNVKVTDNAQVSRNLYLRLNGFAQATNDNLPGSEQIALGGDEFGRAYEASLISGDTGMAGSAELAWRPAKGIPKLLSGSELYSFVDGGRVTYRGRYGFDDSKSHLGSVGGGVRAQIANRQLVQLEAVKGLSNPVFYEDRKVWRVLFSVKSLF
jgi:hemolysin activation/secretion protein